GMGGRCRMSGTSKAICRIVTGKLIAGALIASTIVLHPDASMALDSVTLVIDWYFNGRNAYFFDALDKGYYRDAGIELKIVHTQGSVDAIREVGAGNATFGFIDAATLVLERANDRIPVKLVASIYSRPPHSIYCRDDSGIKRPKD